MNAIIVSIIHGRAERDYNSIVLPTAFTNKLDAYKALFTKLVAMEYLTCADDGYWMDQLEDATLENLNVEIIEGVNISIDGCDIGIDTNDYEKFNAFRLKMSQKICDCITEENFEQILKSYHDSYYLDGWKYQLDVIVI